MYLEVSEAGFSFTDNCHAAVKGFAKIFSESVVINYKFYNFSARAWMDEREIIISNEDGVRKFFEQLKESIEKQLPFVQDDIGESLEDDAEKTEVERQVLVRLAQAKYRENLEKLWDAKCAVTGIKCRELLRASHAKAWAECSSRGERISCFNGFLLNVTLDALFDKFLISFDDEGQILISKKLDLLELQKMGVSVESRLRWIDERHLPYLRWHRKRFDAKELL